MKYLCLAYGAEADWVALDKTEQERLLAQDEKIRDRGALMSAVEPRVLTVRAWNGTPQVTHETFADPQKPLAGFSVIDANDVDEVIALVSKTPCARANGAIEIRPIMAINDAQWVTEHSR